MRNPLINLLQSRTTWGSLRPKLCSRCSSSWTRKSLQLSIMFLLDPKSYKMLVIFLIRKREACSFPSLTLYINTSISLKLSASFRDNLAVLAKAGPSLDLH